METSTEFTEVYRAATIAHAGVVRELLMQNGIDCYINPSTPTLPWDGDVRVLCTTADAARARELIGAFIQAQPPEDEEEDEEDEEDEEEEDEDEDEDEEEDEDEGEEEDEEDEEEERK